MIVCKVCGATNEQGATFCGTCGAFLEWSGEAVQPDGSTQPVGGQQGGVPPVPPPVGPTGPPAGDAAATSTQPLTAVDPPADPAPPPGSIICSNCGMANDPTRVYCSRCATELAAATAPVAAIAAAPPAGRAIPPVAILAAIGGVAVIAVLAFVFLLPKSPPDTGIDTAIPSLADVSVAPSPAASASAQPSASAGASPSAEPSAPASLPPPVPSGHLAMSVLADGDANIVVFTFDGEKQSTLVGGKKFNASDPAFSSDGDVLAYVSTTGPLDPIKASTGEGIRLVNADGSDPKVPDLTHHDVDRNPAWSPDGKFIAFASTRGHKNGKNLDIYARPVKDTTDLIVLADDPADDWDPTYAPDGDTIAFVSRRDGDAHLFTMNANGKAEKPLDLGDGIFDDPAYSPDGKFLAFTHRDERERTEAAVRRQRGRHGHAPARVTSTPTSTTPRGRPTRRCSRSRPPGRARRS